MSNAIDAAENDPQKEIKHWYELISDDKLEQGDILEGIDIAITSPEFYAKLTRKVGFKAKDVIILTQTCDLENAKTPWVYVTPYNSISLFEAQLSKIGKEPDQINRFLESVRRGYMPKFHMINQCDLDPFRMDISIVDFRQVWSLPVKYVKEFVSQGHTRRRMLSPYKEHLGQAYARYYMRVGLPGDIPPFYDLEEE